MTYVLARLDDTIVVVQWLVVRVALGFTLGSKSDNLIPCQMSLLLMRPVTSPICSTMWNTVVRTTPSSAVGKR